MRQCSQCYQVKSHTEYYRVRSEALALRAACKKCTNQAVVARRDPARGREAAQRWRSKNPRKAKSVALFHAYGISVEEYEEMYADQNGKCAICRAITKDALHVDHCHNTGKIRGLLCRACNFGLGHFGDDVCRMTSAIAYLEATL